MKRWRPSSSSASLCPMLPALWGKAFLAYRRRGGARPTPLGDFYIGAHAAIAGYRLLTRDARRYRTYFAGLDVDSPA